MNTYLISNIELFFEEYLHLTDIDEFGIKRGDLTSGKTALGSTETAALEKIMRLSQEEAEKLKEQERNQIPMGRRRDPDEAARWIVALADPSSA